MSGFAELFEKIAHPTRIKILELLELSPMTFGRLKGELGIASSGNLDHHLKKLEGLVLLDSVGLYKLSDEGKDALVAVRIIESNAAARSAPPHSQSRLVLGIMVGLCSAFALAVVITAMLLGTGADTSTGLIGGVVGGMIGGLVAGITGLRGSIMADSRSSRPLTYWPSKNSPWQARDWASHILFVGGYFALLYCITYAALAWGFLNNFLWYEASLLSLTVSALASTIISSNIITKVNKSIIKGNQSPF
jgi:DNA-binding transcriptional ArsR family regulator